MPMMPTPQALPAELARRKTLKAKLDAACARLEAESKAEAEPARPAYEAKQAAYDNKTGNRGAAPVPPDPNPPAERQSNLTDPDSALMAPAAPHSLWSTQRSPISARPSRRRTRPFRPSTPTTTSAHSAGPLTADAT